MLRDICIVEAFRPFPVPFIKYRLYWKMFQMKVVDVNEIYILSHVQICCMMCHF